MKRLMQKFFSKSEVKNQDFTNSLLTNKNFVTYFYAFLLSTSATRRSAAAPPQAYPPFRLKKSYLE
jgi:hypothetical protein